MLKIGIVGLPNVGKSTLFNALTKSKQADAQNYPFCTIEPNVGIVEVPDNRLAELSRTSKSGKTIPTAIEFVDIAGLVKGASEGEGLGNKFLAHIREVDAIAQVVRSFEDGNIVHVHNKVNPKEDADIINLELVLADWQTVSKRLDNTKKKAKGAQAKEVQKEIELLERVAKQLEAGKVARELEYDEEEQKILSELCLLTNKPIMYVVNVDENGIKQSELGIPEIEPGVPHVKVCAKLEAEFIGLEGEELTEYMNEFGLKETGLDKIIHAGYKLLDLVTYFTSGEQESRAWTVHRGTPAPLAAGVIHTDFIKGFIKADVANWEDFVAAGGWSKIKETGKMRLEGKEYIVKDGDVMYFHVST
ncbi:MAG: redox-regulated ATPase YchF [Candidatus Magasanikbacteria bacterium CG11_big_fil_rev_8_21_14_0_20_39_34]|uniref:Ribosome-binding ATPase YchF n=1 Tax=Candidatus Magasanikbacteria bacterium CG11_big_fil_rev_8_21_14_0_20_39_34 TaxID=1974653 RepID=A0A2H0N6H2_9BACT|nr:MAG: redox-regulated ATPase YchF [Candidatus Magasanikbacteria bacterium CG11_big_fil_rev_8_21_14_0_20_39_34]